MQDRFVGDIGDFGKYGLLRALTSIWDWESAGPLPETERLSLGVVWYRNDVQEKNDDGKHTSYLTKPGIYKSCDPQLFECLKDIVDEKERELSSIKRTGILGKDTAFYDAILPKDRIGRQDWVKDAVFHRTIHGKKIVFLDPDNGLATPKMETVLGYSTKHVYLKEIVPFLQRAQTVVIYHHLGRTGLMEGRNCHALQMRDWAKRIAENLTLPDLPRVLWYRRGTARAFFILSARQHSAVIDARLARMLDGPWACHFTRLML